MPYGIRFDGRKGGHATLVEFTPTLRQVVDKLIEVADKVNAEFLICNSTGNRYTLSGFVSIWRRVMTSWVQARIVAGIKQEHFTFHDLRAMSITWILAEGRNAQDLTGHTTSQIIERVYDRRRTRHAKAVR